MKCLLLFILSTAHAWEISKAWVEAPAFPPNVKMYLHESSVTGPASFVAVQSHAARDEKVMRQMKALSAAGAPLAELLPHQCFHLQRQNLSTRQTWCRSKQGPILVFLEHGPLYMSENEILNVELLALAGAR